jgi:hypothetical protein
MSPKCYHKHRFLPYQVLKNIRFWAKDKNFYIAVVFNGQSQIASDIDGQIVTWVP